MNYAIIGYGGIGKCHFGNKEEIKKAHPDVNLVAICDINPDKFKSNVSTNLGNDTTSLNFAEYNTYTDVEEMLKKEKLDFVIAAVPTFLHDEISIRVMKKGVNVLCEKPMAISVERAKNILYASKEYGVKLMIGQCVRFFPAYEKLKEIIDSKKYGKVVKAEFRRLSASPLWSWENWYMDGSKSGGAALDLHVHDVDFINYLFGKPKAVSSVGTNYICEHDSITTIYDYDDLAVVATGDWGLPGKFPFSPSFIVRFEKGAVLMEGGKFKIYTSESVEEVELEKHSGYAKEVIDFINCIKENRESEVNPPEESLVTLEIALAEKESANRNEKVIL